MNIIRYIENSSELLDLYGDWPSFHDEEIHDIKLGTYHKVKEGYDSSYLEFTLRVLEKRSLVTFRFEDIYDLVLDGFCDQNIVFTIEFDVLEPEKNGDAVIKVTIEPSVGVGGEFKAYSATILKIEPCDQNGRKS